MKTCLYHRALLEMPIAGHSAGDPMMQDGLRARIGLRTVVSDGRVADNRWRRRSERERIPITDATRTAFKCITT